MYTIYGIPNCDTIKKTLTWFKEQNIPFEFYDYKKNGIAREKIEEWLKQYPWEEIVNRNSTTWKELHDTEKPQTQDAAIQLMMEKNSVIKRPIVERGNIKAIGFKAADFAQKLAQ